MPSFLLTGLESNFDFITRDNKDIIKIIEPVSEAQKDIRIAVIQWLRNNPIPKL